MADFADTDQLIKAKQLPDVIQQRHDQTVATYQHAFQMVSQQLRALTQEKGTELFFLTTHS